MNFCGTNGFLSLKGENIYYFHGVGEAAGLRETILLIVLQRFERLFIRLDPTMLIKRNTSIFFGENYEKLSDLRFSREDYEIIGNNLAI